MSYGHSDFSKQAEHLMRIALVQSGWICNWKSVEHVESSNKNAPKLFELFLYVYKVVHDFCIQLHSLNKFMIASEHILE